MNIDLDKAAAELASFCWDNGMPGKRLEAEIKEILARHEVHHELEDQIPEAL